jgi:hypothetical protein
MVKLSKSYFFAICAIIAFILALIDDKAEL